MQTQKQLEARMAMERRMVRRLIRTAKVHGYAVVKVDDGEEVHKATESDALLAALTRLSNAAFARDTTMGDQCGLFAAQAELRDATKSARAAITKAGAASS